MERVLTARPDVLVCDLGMPGEDGYSLIRKLRLLEENRESALPAVALTAYARSEDRTRVWRHSFRLAAIRLVGKGGESCPGGAEKG